MNNQLNLTQVNIGCQGSGKSVDAMFSALEEGAEFDPPAQIIIHDLGGAAIRNHELFGGLEYREYHTGTPKEPFGSPDIVLINTANGEDALVYAMAPHRRKKKRIVVVDEVTACSKILPSGIMEPWKSAIAQRRHLNIGFIFCMQSPTMASRYLVSTATKIKAFRVNHANDLKALILIGYTKEHAELICKFKQREHLELVQGITSNPVKQLTDGRNDSEKEKARNTLFGDKSMKKD